MEPGHPEAQFWVRLNSRSNTFREIFAQRILIVRVSDENDQVNLISRFFSLTAPRFGSHSQSFIDVIQVHEPIIEWNRKQLKSFFFRECMSDSAWPGRFSRNENPVDTGLTKALIYFLCCIPVEIRFRSLEGIDEKRSYRSSPLLDSTLREDWFGESALFFRFVSVILPWYLENKCIHADW
jgi:hypothetical protein